MKLKKLTVKLTTLFIALSLAFSSFGASVILAQEAPSAPSAPTYEDPAPTPPPAPTYEDPAPTPPPAPTYEESTTSADDGSSTEGQNSSGEGYTGEYSGTEAINSGNGAGSDNTSNAETNNETTIDSSNSGTVQNAINVEGSTGGNDASRNTGGTSSIQSGDSNVGIIVETNLNTTIVSGSSCCGGGVSAVNSDNGSNSTNSSSASSDTTNETTIDNNAKIDTEIVGLSLTGDNDASRNVGDSIILTGDANLSATVITDANTTAMGVYNFDVNGNQSGDIVLGENSANCVNCDDSDSVVATNSGNGSDSTNEANASSTTTTEETITNDADVVNDINLTASSGDNDASRNTGGDSTIVTGDANVAANVINTLNTVVSGTIYTVNIFGNLVGNILLPQEQSSGSGCGDCCNQNVTASNTDNGANSENTAEASSTNTSTTTQTNNATIQNNLNIDGTTGNNEANFNTAGDSVIDTGEVNVSASTLNVANLNVSGSPCDPPVYLVFVNQLGQWVGQILGAPEGSYYYGSDGIVYLVGPGGELIATNSGNGAGSTNTASATSENTTTVNQTNNATITNNINIDANTGGNSTSRNTGGNNSITTGDANIVVNLVNFINSNFSGRKVVLTLVNVFGSWLGNFVPPGFSAESGSEGDSGQSSSSGPSSSSQSSSSSSSESSSAFGGSSSDNGSQTRVTSRFGNLLGRGGGVQSVTDDKTIQSIGAGADSQETGGFSINWKLLLLILPVLAIYAAARRFALARKPKI